MNPQLTPDDVRAIVREEIGVDCPLSPEVAAEALRAKAVAGLVVQDTRGLGTDGPLDALTGTPLAWILDALPAGTSSGNIEAVQA